MYNHALTISDGIRRYEAVVESLPVDKETIAVWIADFGIPADEVIEVQAQLTEWFHQQNIEYVFNDGRGR